MSRHVMLDLETLSTKAPGVILSIGAVRFDLNGIQNNFCTRIDVGSQLLRGFHVDPATVQWWQKQDVRAKEEAFYIPYAVTIEEALQRFASFVDKDTYLWAKGPDFDCVMLATAYQQLDGTLPWSFRNHRDVRTMLALSKVKQKVGQLAHSAIDDATVQAEAVIEAYKVLGREME